MNEVLFKESYAGLNQEQKRAVDALDGPVMVIAGPGTGKTQTLILRIANLVRQRKAKGEEILALTYTRSGEEIMRERLITLLGREGYEVNIFTFHSFCTWVMSTFPDFSPRAGAALIDEVEKLNLFEQILKGGEFEFLIPRGNPSFYLGKFEHPISCLKQNLISPSKYEEYLQERRQILEDLEGNKKREESSKLKKAMEFQRVYAEYEKGLEKLGWMDYEDLIIEVVGALDREKKFREILSERFSYILADEHQDSNSAQNLLLEFLGGENPHLFVVGDQRQAIYAFQGASLENFLGFRKKFKPQVFSLIQNYRSNASILEVVNAFSQKLQEAVEEEHHSLYSPLKTDNTETFSVEVKGFRNEMEEFDFLLDEIQQDLKKGVPAEEIVILSRRNAQLEKFATFLRRRSILFSFFSRNSLFSSRAGRNFYCLLRMLGKFGEEKSLLEFLHSDFCGASPYEVWALMEKAKEKRISLYETIRTGDFTVSSSFFGLFEKLEELSQLGWNTTLPEFLESCLRMIEVREWASKQENRFECFEILRSFYLIGEKIHSKNPEAQIKVFLSYLGRVKEFSLDLKMENYLPKNRIRLMTVHKAKGKEFENVYLLDMTSGHWEKNRNTEFFPLPWKVDSKKEMEEEEARLFYVALSRAKKRLKITYSKHSSKAFPSSFLEEVGLQNPLPDFPFEEEKSLEILEKQLFHEKEKGEGEEEFLKNLFFHRGISPTGLNHLFRDPWDFFFLDVLRIPGAKNDSLIFGTAIHSALQEFFQHPKKNTLSEYFIKSLSKESLEKEQEKRLRREGEKILNAYSRYYKLENYIPILGEKMEERLEIQVPLKKFGESLKLRGKIDHIIPNERGGFRVIDYKTGKRKTRGHIEGKTKAEGSGDYKRQLLFYQLLCEEGGLGRVDSARIDFIESKEGKFYQEDFIFSLEEVKDFQSQIVKKVEEFLTFEFLKNRPRPKSDFYEWME